MSLRYINNNSQEIAIAGQGANGRDGEGVHVGTIIGYNGSANDIPEGYEIVEDVSFGGGMPIGSGCDYYGTTPPEDFLFADGSEISRTTYAKLFAIIGTTYGAGDGSTTFNLPDKRERVSVMYKSGSTNGTSNATLGTLGAKGGEFKHTLTKAELPAIQLQGTYDSVNLTMNSSGYGVFKLWGGTKGNLLAENLGSGTAHNVMQPYLVCNYIIKVK